MKSPGRLLPFSFVVVSFCSCGIYTFSSSALGDVKTIAIPLFDNRTTESGLRENLTDGLSQAFVKDNTLKVAPEQQADAVLKGTVISYVREAYTYSQAEVVSQYVCRIGIDAELINRKSGKTMWEEKGLTDWGTYDSATETEQDGQNRAIAKLIEDILNKTVKGW